MIVRLLVFCLTLAALPQAVHAQDKWTAYRNTRFGTAIEYPTRFKPGRPPDNNDGQSFEAADGATLSVWGSFNALDHDVAALEEFLRENGKDEKITYRAAGPNWLVLSGTSGDRIFYQKYMFSHRNEVENAFRISYPAGVAGTYNPIAARIAKSLKAGRGYQTTGAP